MFSKNEYDISQSLMNSLNKKGYKSLFSSRINGSQCDLIGIMGEYSAEFEIKSDGGLTSDFSKPTKTGHSKHLDIVTGKRTNMFYFVTPYSATQKYRMISDKYGIIHFRETKRGYTFIKYREAQMLHDRKVDVDFMFEILRTAIQNQSYVYRMVKNHIKNL